MFQKLHTPQTIGNQLPEIKTEQEFPRSVDKTSWPSVHPVLIHFPLTRLYLADDLDVDLRCVIPTFHDHFPKPCRRGRPSGFRRAGRRRCQSAMIGRCGRGRGKLPPRKTAGLSAFTCDCAVGYHAVMMAAMRSRGRSGYRMSLGPTGYSSVREWRFFFQRNLPFWFRKSSFWLSVIWKEKRKILVVPLNLKLFDPVYTVFCSLRASFLRGSVLW